MAWLDGAMYFLALPVLLWIFLNGWDELFIDISYIVLLLRGRIGPGDAHLQSTAPAEKRIAILVPLWREHLVIEEMVHHNVSALDYREYDIYLGLYPNDSETLEKVLALEVRYPNVRHAMCPHDGPTNKADCLNWLYRRMEQEETELGIRYEVVVQHDAEDLIHPASLSVISAMTDRFDMVQIPVFPLENGFVSLTQNSYCDEFAEWQLKDLAVRQQLGGFLPSAGVGTAYRRDLLKELARGSGDGVFHTGTVTEDYEIGLRVSRLGRRQALVAERVACRARGIGNGDRHNGKVEYVATREYFPRDFWGAVRQKSRWIMGVSLEAWQHHGWGIRPRQWYWLWRDRKGLIGNVASMVCNVVLFYCLLMGAASLVLHTGWSMSRLFPAHRAAWLLLLMNTFFLAERLFFRVFAVYRIYGPGCAAGAVPRTLWANLINFFATVKAVATFAAARLRRREIAWLKTEHAYPDREQLLDFKRLLGEFLLEQHVLTRAELDGILLLQSVQRKPLRIGELVVRCALGSEQQVVNAVARQHGLPVYHPGQLVVSDGAGIPRALAERFATVPVALRGDAELLVASPEVPVGNTIRELQVISGRTIYPSLATPSDWEVAFAWIYARVEAEVADALVNMGALLPLHVVEAGAAARQYRRPLPQILYDRHWADEMALARAFRDAGYEFRRVQSRDVKREVSATVPAWLQRQLRAVPLERRQDTVVIAIAEAIADADRCRLEAAAGAPVELVFTLLSDLLPLLPKVDMLRQ